MLLKSSCKMIRQIPTYLLFQRTFHKLKLHETYIASQRINMISYMFSTNNHKINQTKIKQAAKKLLENYNKLKPQVSIEMLYKLRSQIQQLDAKTLQQILPEDKEIQIIKSAIEQLSSIRKIQIVGYVLKLLQKHNLTYKRDNKWTVLINRYFLYLKLVKISVSSSIDYAKEFRIILQLLNQMHFPRNTINKVLSVYLDGVRNNNMNNSTSKAEELLKIIIMALQNKKIYLSITKGLIQQALKNYEFQSFQCLAMLFYIKQILNLCIKEKISYQLSEGQIKDIMLNPFQNESVNHENIETKGKQQQIKQRQTYLDNIKKALQKQGQELQKECDNKLQLERIKQQILKFIQSQDIPLTAKNMFYLVDFIELKPRIKQFFDQNFITLRPVQFMYFLKKVCQGNKSYIQEQNQQYKKILLNYIEKLQGYMDATELIYLYNEANKTGKIPINLKNIQTIVNKIEQNKSISYLQFSGVAELLSNLPKKVKQQQQKQIQSIITKLNDIVGK